MTSQPTIENNGQQAKNWRGWFFGIFAIAGVAGIVFHFGEVQAFAKLVERAQPFWLMLAIALQLSTYASVASGWSVILKQAGSAQPLSKLMRIAVSKLFADQAVPSAGMGGNVLLVRQLEALGVPRSDAVAALLVSLIGFYAAFAVMAVVMMLLLWMDHKATSLMAGVVTAFLFVAFSIPSLALWLRHRGSEPLPPRLERIAPVRMLLELMADAPSRLVNNTPLILRVTGLNALIFLADSITLWVCLRAIGENAPYTVAFIALVMAQIVAAIGLVPLGLGSFEATATTMLHLLGMPLESAFAATMLLRLFTMWLPMLPGLFLMRRSLGSGIKERQAKDVDVS
ncbi:lysylphosphatidylglycerol synthase transmembrane domain-containing protein [Parasphingorhabdus sp.]|uniref:lysylphosphatidylglycerol synthase transmembrane domain-containing protein n=1 Tax=Parasphingorhabdus sp. TaxID=2709688 RepID=UPI003A92C809